MNQLQAHRKLKLALDMLEKGLDSKDIVSVVKASMDDLGDPFAGEIDDFLKEKQDQSGVDDGTDDTETDVTVEDEETLNDEAVPVDEPVNLGDNTPEPDHPQEEAEDAVEEESVVPEIDNEDSPQEELEDEYEETTEEAAEDKVEELEQTQDTTDQEIDKLENQVESFVESKLRAISAEVQKRGFRTLAYHFIAATNAGVVDTLNSLLLREYQQRDTLMHYLYLFDNDEQKKKYLLDHFDGERNRLAFLQKQIKELGGNPTTSRLSILPVTPATPEGVLALNAQLERQAAADYLAAAKSLEIYPEHAALKSWLESVAQDETKDMQDMQKLQDKEDKEDTEESEES